MKRSRITAAAAALMMLLSLTACGGGNNGSTPAPAETSAAVSTEEQTEETAQEPEKTPVPEMTPMRDIKSIDLIKEMKVGWSLGNTLDATIGKPKGDEPTSAWETAWGQPVTSKIMIDSIAAKGFNVLRIPVTWQGKFDDTPEHNINPEWIARVKEVVDYGIENDMFVIINLHHEDWHMPTYENEAKAREIICALWSQIADYFEDYNEKLIFEGLNEPRLKGTPKEWTGGDAEARDVINHWNAAFVETIRSKGGNNAKRHLMVPTYAASTTDTVLGDMVIPQDEKVILSVHAYTPYRFALAENKDGTDEWSADNPNDTRDINKLLETLKELYIDQGQAVIIGEMGARSRNNNEARSAWARYYIDSAQEAGIPCCFWDNGSFVGSGENFGLYDRKNLEWRNPTYIDAIMAAVND